MKRLDFVLHINICDDKNADGMPICKLTRDNAMKPVTLLLRLKVSCKKCGGLSIAAFAMQQHHWCYIQGLFCVWALPMRHNVTMQRRLSLVNPIPRMILMFFRTALWYLQWGNSWSSSTVRIYIRIHPIEYTQLVGFVVFCGPFY